jgi:hypothetical protein
MAKTRAKTTASRGGAGGATTQAPRYPIITAQSWTHFRDLVEGPKYRSWAFRGQADAIWPMWSSLSRHLRYATIDPRAWTGQEERILRIFKRKSHLFLQHIPAERDSFEWLALMQHHGAPTRLLDATWSPYVAMFFALERGASTAAIWAFNAGALNAMDTFRLRDGRRIDLRHVGTWEHESYERHFLRARAPFVILGEPKTMNRRLIAQSGTFVVPSMLHQPVEAIIDGYANSAELLIKIEIDVAAMREEAMRSLYGMNITNATLFPDLDGLARSMAFELEYHWAFDPRTMVPNAGFPAPKHMWFWGDDASMTEPPPDRTTPPRRARKSAARRRAS